MLNDWLGPMTSEKSIDPYKKFGKMLKSLDDESKKVSREIIRDELKKLGFQPYLPIYLRERLLDLRGKVDLPLLNVPPHVFDKHGLLSKRQYYSRLATLIVDLGLAYQRARLQYPRMEDLRKAIKETFNLEISQRDVKAILALLEDVHVIRRVNGNFYEFEPLMTSKCIVEMLEIATTVWKNEKRGCTIDDFLKRVSLDETAIRVILDDLEKQGICKNLNGEYWFVGME